MGSFNASVLKHCLCALTDVSAFDSPMGGGMMFSSGGDDDPAGSPLSQWVTFESVRNVLRAYLAGLWPSEKQSYSLHIVVIMRLGYEKKCSLNLRLL